MQFDFCRLQKTSLFTLFIFFFLSFSLTGQQNKGLNDHPDTSLRIGLALSGGSAHGFAHIGVIKYLEEQDVKIDFVTGTSMGAIIGGLYAMGFSSDQITRVAANQDWSALLTSFLPLNEVSPSEKEYHDRFALRLVIDKNGIHLPRGLINSHKLDLLISRLYSGAFSIDDFDQLIRPFRCMAVDIETGETIAFRDGYLGDAIRASMAIPSIFSPVEYQGRLLVDGGLRRNFPVEEVKGLGADYVIGVYVGTLLRKKEELSSLIDILGQSAFMMGALDSEIQKEGVDVLIEPQVNNMPNFAFDRHQEFIDLGYEAAKARHHEITELKRITGNGQTNKTDYMASPSAIAINSVRFPNTKGSFEVLARSKFGPIPPGPISYDDIEAGLTRIFGTGHFEKIRYRFDDSEEGVNNLDIFAVPKREFAFLTGINFFSSTGSSIIVGTELRNLLTELSTLSLTFRISQNFGGSADYQKRIGTRKNLILHLRSKFHLYDQDIYELDILRRKFGERQFENIAGLGLELGANTIINLQSGYNYYFTKPISNLENGLRKYSRADLFARLLFSHDSRDSRSLASQGFAFHFSLSYFNLLKSRVTRENVLSTYIPFDGNYFSFSGRINQIASINPKLALENEISFGWKSANTFLDNYRLGGLEERGLKSISVLGLRTNQFHFSKFFSLSTKARYEIAPLIFLSANLAYIRGLRTFNTLDAVDRDIDMTFWSYGLVCGIKTPFGPIKAGVGFNTATNQIQTSLVVGYTFL